MPLICHDESVGGHEVSGDARTKPAWVGKITVRALPGNESLEARGAYVWVVAPATSADEYLEAARTALEQDGFEALEADDFRPAVGADLWYSLKRLVSEVETSQIPAIDDTFFTFPDSELEDDAS